MEIENQGSCRSTGNEPAVEHRTIPGGKPDLLVGDPVMCRICGKLALGREEKPVPQAAPGYGYQPEQDPGRNNGAVKVPLTRTGHGDCLRPGGGGTTLRCRLMPEHLSPRRILKISVRKYTAESAGGKRYQAPCTTSMAESLLTAGTSASLPPRA